MLFSFFVFLSSHFEVEALQSFSAHQMVISRRLQRSPPNVVVLDCVVCVSSHVSAVGPFDPRNMTVVKKMVAARGPAVPFFMRHQQWVPTRPVVIINQVYHQGPGTGVLLFDG